MNKKNFILPILLAFLFSSCGMKLDPALEEYMDTFSYEEGYETYLSGTIVYEQSAYDNDGNLTSLTTETTSFLRYEEEDEERYYIGTEIVYELDAIQSGINSYFTDLRYEDGEYVSRLYRNEEILEINYYTSSEALEDYTLLFYTSEVSIMKSGGLYYGDLIATSTNSLERGYFKIEDGLLIIYTYVEDYEGTYHEQYITVNSLGYLVSFSWYMLDLDSGIYGYIKQDVTYNTITSLPSLPYSN